MQSSFIKNMHKKKKNAVCGKFSQGAPTLLTFYSQAQLPSNTVALKYQFVRLK